MVRWWYLMPLIVARIGQFCCDVIGHQKCESCSDWLDYSIDSYSSIRITEHTEYQFPKEQTLCYSENRIADVTKIDMMRPRKMGENFQKNMITGYSVCSKQTAVLSFLLSGEELTEYYSVQSGIRIGHKRTQLLSIPCILIPE